MCQDPAVGGVTSYLEQRENQDSAVGGGCLTFGIEGMIRGDGDGCRVGLKSLSFGLRS